MERNPVERDGIISTKRALSIGRIANYGAGLLEWPDKILDRISLSVLNVLANVYPDPEVRTRS